MTSSERTYVAWIRDLHALETLSERVLRGAAGRMAHEALVRERLLLHAQETCTQEHRLRQCLVRHQADTSLVRDVGSRLMAAAQTFSAAWAADEVVRTLLALQAFKALEIGAYRCLMAAAEARGDLPTHDLCAASLAEEEAMAQWLHEQVPRVAADYLLRVDAAGPRMATR